MSAIETLLRNAFIVSGNDERGAYLGDMSAKAALAEFAALRAENERLLERNKLAIEQQQKLVAALMPFADAHFYYNDAGKPDDCRTSSAGLTYGDFRCAVSTLAALSGEIRAAPSKTP